MILQISHPGIIRPEILAPLYFGDILARGKPHKLDFGLLSEVVGTL